MHISEGILSPAVLGVGAVLAAGGTAIGLRRLAYDHLMTVAILAAAFFVGSLIHVPVGPIGVHLILNGLLGVILGWAAFPAILVALMLQAVLFQYGGITTLGVNTFNMAFPGVLAWYLFRPLLFKSPRLRLIGAFCCGALAVAGAGCLTALSLAFTDEGFLRTAQILFVAHIPVMLVEGVITALTISFLAKVRPEILHFAPPMVQGAFAMRTTLFLCLITGLFCLASAPAWAHRVNIFAYVDGGDILVECGFNRSQKVRQGQIEVFDAATGDMLLRGTTDNQGEFRFPIPPQARQDGHALRIHINAGEGHQNTWTVAAAEFAAAPAAHPAPPTRETSTVPETPSTAEAAATGAATPADVERIVNAALDAKLAPVKRMLAERFETGPGLREIIGGIGWIFGMIGVAAYVRRRG